MNDQFWKHQVCAHEAGHAVVGLALGKKCCRAKLIRDEAGNLLGGQTRYNDSNGGDIITDPQQAFIEMIHTCAGHIAEGMLCHPDTIRTDTDCDNGSDKLEMMALAMQWGEKWGDSVLWTVKAQSVARTILAYYFKQLMNAADALESGQREIDWMSECLQGIYPDPKWAKLEPYTPDLQPEPATTI